MARLSRGGVVTLPVVMVLAEVSYAIVEQPAIHFGDYLLRRRQSGAVHSAISSSQ